MLLLQLSNVSNIVPMLTDLILFLFDGSVHIGHESLKIDAKKGVQVFNGHSSGPEALASFMRVFGLDVNL